MNTPMLHKRPTRPMEWLRARDLMSSNPVSIRRDATIREALAILTDRGYGAAPVIDDAGRPIGVVSRTDILIHCRESVRHDYACDNTEWDLFPEPVWTDNLSAEATGSTTVAEVMTPAVFTVPLNASAREVVRRMLELKVHHLFVVDGDLALVGVISPLDVLRHLSEGD